MTLLGSIFDILYAFGPSIGYVFQYKEIGDKKNSEGFSPLTCIIILVSMIARVFFWSPDRSGVPVLIQAIVLAISQVTVCVSIGYFVVSVPEVCCT